MKQVAIQGFEGSFHHQATSLFFGTEPKLTTCDTFQELTQSVAKHDMLGVMAVENTIAGTMVHNYRMIIDNNLQIIGEQRVRIKHNLCALPGTKLDDIKEVHSHYMAILQCEDFLNVIHKVKRVSTTDTAKSAKDIVENQWTTVAAICSEKAAEYYGLEILERGIETNKENYTRFLVLSKASSALLFFDSKKCNKATIAFTLPHKRGSLSQILSIFSFYDLNLTKIESSPVIGEAWRYQFYVDLAFSDYTVYQQAIAAVSPLLEEFIPLGLYGEKDEISL